MRHGSSGLSNHYYPLLDPAMGRVTEKDAYDRYGQAPSKAGKKRTFQDWKAILIKVVAPEVEQVPPGYQLFRARATEKAPEIARNWLQDSG